MSAGDQNYVLGHMNQAVSQSCGSGAAWANHPGQTAIHPGDLFFTTASVSKSVSDIRWTQVDQCVGMYDNCARRIAAYEELEIEVPEHLLEDLETYRRKAKAAHREAQEAEREALRAEIRALQSKEQKRRDAEEKLRKLEEKLK